MDFSHVPYSICDVPLWFQAAVPWLLLLAVALFVIVALLALFPRHTEHPPLPPWDRCVGCGGEIEPERIKRGSLICRACRDSAPKDNNRNHNRQTRR